MSPPNSISDSMANAEWDSLAYALTTLDHGIEGDDAASKRLRAQLGMVRVLLSEEIRGWNGSGTIDLSFFIASVKTVHRVEKEYNARKVKNREFLTFLKLLLYKFGKQKIKAKKPLAIQAEFGRMKGVVESRHAAL